jgi:2-dehydropantoate 2-reductase
MRTVLGAGSVGLALAAQLASLGEVLVVTRRREAAERLAGGLRVEDPATGEVDRVRVVPRVGVAAAAREIGEGPVYVCVRVPDTASVADALAEHAPDCIAVCVQNDLGGDALLARRQTRVVSAVWRRTCTRVSDDHVRFIGRGRVVVGARSPDSLAAARSVAAELGAAGLDVSLSERVEEDQWLKLCINLMSAPNALVRRDDHDTASFVELKARLLEEARDVLAAAGIPARPCHGGDRTLEEEIRAQREALAHGTSARRLPLYNHVWTGLREGRPVEADAYHRRILELGREHGVDVPVNARVLAALERAVEEALGPERSSAEELLR